MNKRSVIMTILLLSVAILMNSCMSQIHTAGGDPNGDRIDSDLNMHVISHDAKGENKATNVTVKKYAKAENGIFKFYYDITTPRVDDYLFILALDSSGSFAYNGGGNPSRQADAVIDATKKFLEDTNNKYKTKNFNLSIVSWDNNIDFAYTRNDFKNDDPSKVKLVPIKDVIDDIAMLSPFVAPDQEGIPYRCEEGDYTDLSQPINASLKILNAKVNQPDDSHRVKKFIIIVTGEGETTSCSPRLIEEAKGIPIYVVGMEFRDRTKLWNHLAYDICDDPSNFFRTPSNSESLKDDLLKSLEAALGKALSDPVASNVSLIEPIDGCFIPNKNATIVIKSHPGNEIPVLGVLNQTTIEYIFPNGLYPENVTELSFDATFALDFPVSRVDMFLPSRLTYTWFNNKDFNISIPKNEIRMETLAPTQSQASASLLAKSEKSNGNSPKPVQSDGFGVMQLLTAIVLCRFAKMFRS